MNGFNLKHLENCFRSAIDSEYNYVAVRIHMKGFERDEIIINPIENAESKLAYYKSAYNNDLTHIHAGDKIQIVGFTFGDTFNEIEEDFFGSGV